MADRLEDGRQRWLLNVLDDFIPEGPGIADDFSLPAERAVRALTQIIEWRGGMGAIRPDNGPKCISGTRIEWAENRGIGLTYTHPGRLRQNAYIKRYNRTVRHEWLDFYIFESFGHHRHAHRRTCNPAIRRLSCPATRRGLSRNSAKLIMTASRW